MLATLSISKLNFFKVAAITMIVFYAFFPFEIACPHHSRSICLQRSLAFALSSVLQSSVHFCYSPHYISIILGHVCSWKNSWLPWYVCCLSKEAAS